MINKCNIKECRGCEYEEVKEYSNIKLFFYSLCLVVLGFGILYGACALVLVITR